MTPSLHLMLLAGDAVPEPVPAAFIDALHHVRVTSATGVTNGFQLTFAMSPRSQLRQAVVPGGALDVKRRVVVAVALAGRCQVLMDGLITRQEMHAGRAPGASFLTVTGEDLSVLMDLQHVRCSYPGLAPHLRAETVCARYAQYGITARAVPPVLTEQPNPAVTIPVQAATDLAYLRAMAADVGHVFHIEPGPVPGASTAYWGPQKREGDPQPALTTGCGAADNVEDLSFAHDGLSVAHYRTHFVDPGSRSISEIVPPEPQVLYWSLAAHPAPALCARPLTGQTGRSLPQARLAGLGRTVSGDPVTAQGTLNVLRYGHVLGSHRLVGVRGAGPAYDGTYAVRDVTHDLTRTTFRQHFTLVRDGLVSDTQVVNP
ncbi:hypothetical protein ACFVFQ_29755 [Streptomyces sp. NPDC057743]|uniref:hypothetical protein n=1 Tax=Streptomyces sp. NPDC057743 TaxID=3346236 RepID=UPI00369A9F86